LNRCRQNPLKNQTLLRLSIYGICIYAEQYKVNNCQNNCLMELVDTVQCTGCINITQILRGINIFTATIQLVCTKLLVDFLLYGAPPALWRYDSFPPWIGLDRDVLYLP